jgi:methyl-accepting chemotaxis protein
VERINEALQEQSAACRSAVEFLEAMHQRTRTNQEAVRRLDGVGQDLLTAAQGLRADLDRFRV